MVNKNRLWWFLQQTEVMLNAPCCQCFNFGSVPYLTHFSQSLWKTYWTFFVSSFESLSGDFEWEITFALPHLSTTWKVQKKIPASIVNVFQQCRSCGSNSIGHSAANRALSVLREL
jgi:hypothetical protein